MELLVSTGVPPHAPVPFTIFREEWEPTAQPLAEEEEELVLVIPTQIPDTVFYEDSNGERETRPKTPWSRGKRVQIIPREWDADTPIKAPPLQELPRTPGRISPNPDLDENVEILEFVEEVDAQGLTKSIKQRKKKKTQKRKRESGQSSEKSGKKKLRKLEAEALQLAEPTERTQSLPATEPTEQDHGPPTTEPAPAMIA